jgi:chromosome segregation protein
MDHSGCYLEGRGVTSPCTYGHNAAHTMKIKRLDVHGFKSFVDRTTLTFPDAITAIVGPNGCGKSNIVDAVRWAMGEQSARHLRGRAMEDVIFAGSESRGPAGFAEVALTFDARAMPGNAAPGGVPWGAVGPEEVVVTRRLHRDGTSEYLLGGVPARLRDIVDFFLGTGVGTKAYSIIEQGRIGFIVSSRAEDRRGLIDEAAGITKYKAKKKLAERRMEATRQHLLRVSDILGELDSRLRSLRIAAQKAERYKRYRAELRDLELWSAAQRYLGLLAEEKQLERSSRDINTEHESALTRVLQGEALLESERLALTEELNELSAAKDELFALSNRADLGAQRSQHYAEEARGLAERRAAAALEMQELGRRMDASALELGALQASVVSLDSEAAEQQRACRLLEQKHEELRSRLFETRARLDRATAEGGAALQRVARLESEIEAAALRREEMLRRLGGKDVEDAALTAAILARAAELVSAEQRLELLRERVCRFETRRDEAETRAARLKQELARGDIELDTLREEAHRRRSRLESLREIQTRYESFQRGVRAIMKRYRAGLADTERHPGSDSALRTVEALEASEASGGGSLDQAGEDRVAKAQPWASRGAIRGLVADIVQPPPELETAVEAVLGDRLGNIIVESHEVGVDAIEFLKRRSEGRSSFIPLTLRAPSAPPGTVLYDASGLAGGESPDGAAAFPLALPAEATEEAWPPGPGVRGPMLELIGYDRSYHRVAVHLLGDVLVCEDLATALALWRRTRAEKTIVTLEGEVIDPHGVVTGGSRESAVAGILSQRREIRELEEIVARIEVDLEQARARQVGLKQALAEATQLLTEIGTVLRQDEVALIGEEKDVERAGRDRVELAGRQTKLAAEQQEIAEALRQTEERLREARAALEDQRRISLDAEKLGGKLRTDTLALSEQLDALVAELGTVRVAASQAEERRASARATLDRLARAREEQAARRARLESSFDEEGTHSEELEAESERLREQAALDRAEAEERARVQAEREADASERNAALARAEADLRSARERVARLAQGLSSFQLRCQEASLKRASLEEQVGERYRAVRLGELVFDYHLRHPVGQEEEGRMGELRGLIDRMGEINLTAIEESAELQKRYDYLGHQKEDLESAISKLERAIEKINKASRRRFREVFDAVNLKFQEIFPRCFGGGRAKLALTDETDLLETGVEIIANPPGKKVMQSIELLSGGEKAMTAVSLLFAIFLVKPSPFCLLDEVDAPLDEANVVRLNQMLRELTDRAQFIVITHNRRTMENADRLCGITMEEPGVSRLVAVNLRGARRSGSGGSGSAPGNAGNEQPTRAPVVRSA